MGKFIARDAIIIAFAWLIWIMAAGHSSADGMVADFSGFVAGTLIGVSAFLIHEWGHVLGAIACGSTLHINQKLSSQFIFSFDPEHNSLRQFVLMSLAGFAATAGLVLACYLGLPEGYLATRVARGAVLFLAFLGVTLELPLLLFAIASRTVPAAAAVSVKSVRTAAVH